MSIDEPGTTIPKPDSEPPDRTVLVPFFEAEGASQMLALSGWVARNADAGLVVLISATYPEQTSLARASADLDASYRIRAADLVAASEVPAEAMIRVGRNHERNVLSAVEERDSKLLVLEDRIDPLAPHRRAHRIAERADCDSVVVSRAANATTLESVLLPVADGSHSGLAVDVARGVAAANDASVTVLHVIESDASERERERARRVVDAVTDRLGADIDVATRLLTDDESAAAIVTQAAQYDATVIGAPRQNRLRRFVYGPTTGPVRDDARTPVLTVRSNQARRSWLDIGDEESIA